MPPGALKRYLQFPQQQSGDDEALKRLLQNDPEYLKKFPPQRKAGQQDEDKPSAAAQVQQPPASAAPPPPTAPAPQSMPNGYGVPQAPGPSAAPHQGIDQDINDQMAQLKGIQGQRPPMPGGGPPQMAPLPQRPQASPWEAIPQLLAGAGNVFSAGSNHPQDYLTPLMDRQQGKRDQVYNDQLAQAHNMFENQRAAYSDTLMRHAMEQRDQQEKFTQAKSMLDTLIEQKYLGKSPQDTAYQGQLDWARGLYKDTQNPQDIKNMAERLSKQYPEKAKALQEAAQEALAVNQVQFQQTKDSYNRMGNMLPEAVGNQFKAMTVPSGTGALGRTPVLGAPRGYRVGYGIPGPGWLAAGGIDAAEAAGIGDFSGGPKYGGPAVHLPPMTEEEQKKYLEEKGKKKSSFRQKLEDEQQRQGTQRFMPLGY